MRGKGDPDWKELVVSWKARQSALREKMIVAQALKSAGYTTVIVEDGSGLPHAEELTPRPNAPECQMREATAR